MFSRAHAMTRRTVDRVCKIGVKRAGQGRPTSCPYACLDKQFNVCIHTVQSVYVRALCVRSYLERFQRRFMYDCLNTTSSVRNNTYE